jgi:hypothetical protein
MFPVALDFLSSVECCNGRILEVGLLFVGGRVGGEEKQPLQIVDATMSPRDYSASNASICELGPARPAGYLHNCSRRRAAVDIREPCNQAIAPCFFARKMTAAFSFRTSIPPVVRARP